MELNERIRAYVAKMPLAVSGQNGSAACMAVAGTLVWGWDLSIEAAMPFLHEYSMTCLPPWSEKELLHKLRSAEKRSGDKPRGHLRKGSGQRPCAPLPAAPKVAPKKDFVRAEWAKIDRAAIANFTSGMPTIDRAWFARRSPVAVEKVSSADFLAAIFEDGDRVIIFTRYYSQGDFIYWVGKGGFRLSDEMGTAAAKADLPTRGRLGVWYLVQPISGKWEIGERVKDGAVKMTRRSEANVTHWVHFVLESDELEPEIWMQVVAALRLPIVAIYSSGGRSLHALVRYAVDSKPHWDEVKKVLEKLVCPLGADPGALSAVRLSRLPGCFREGKESGASGAKKYERYAKPLMQELIYLNPRAGYESIFSMGEVRE